MSRGVFRRPHFAPRYRGRVYLPSAPAAAAAASLPLRVNPIRRLLAGAVFRPPPHVPRHYRRRVLLPSAAPAAVPVSLALRVHPAKALLGGALFRPPTFAPYYRPRAWLPSLTPAAVPTSLPLRVNPMRRLLAGEVFRRPYFAPTYGRRAFLPSLAPTAPVSRPPPVRARRGWRLARPRSAPYYYRTRRLLPGTAAAAPPIAVEVFAEDLSAFFGIADFAVAASWTPAAGGASQHAQVLRDAPDEEWLAGAVQSREVAITYRATQLVGLKTGESITVDGVAYTVREVAALDDGAVMRATLIKP